MTAQATAAQYEKASARAKGKAVHGAPAGSLDAGNANSWQGPKQGDCGWRPNGRYQPTSDPNAQLRSAYVRITVGAVSQGGWTSEAGKPKWVAIGVICPKCGTFWAKPGGIEQ